MKSNLLLIAGGILSLMISTLLISFSPANKDDKSPPVASRYFYISYETAANNVTTTGGINFSVRHYPSEGTIDSIIATQLEYKIDCYSGIVILSIYEFKSRADFVAFNGGVDGKPYSGYSSKGKKDCDDDDDTGTLFFHDFDGTDTTMNGKGYSKIPLNKNSKARIDSIINEVRRHNAMGIKDTLPRNLFQ